MPPTPHAQPQPRGLSSLAPVAVFVLTLALWTSVHPGLAAQPLVTGWDPECRLPRITVADPSADGSRLRLLAGDSLEDAASWPVVAELRGDGHAHHWIDPESRLNRLRLYRLEKVPAPPLAPVPNFRLTDHQGRSHELFREGLATGVVLAFVDREVLAATWAALAPLRERYGPRGVLFWLIDPVDSRPDLAEAARAAGLPVPVLEDRAQLVARTFAAAEAGEVILLETSRMSQVYRGPVEDVVAGDPGTVRRQAYLAEALDQMLAGQAARWERVRARGRPLALAGVAPASYVREIGPLLKARCATCHRPGGIGSFAMTNHASVASRRESVRINLLEGLMPPWHADPAHQRFANDFSLTPSEQAALVAWLDAGAPADAGADPLAQVDPPPAEWEMGPPTRVLSIATQSLPARGEVPYRYLLVPNPFTTNVWLRAAAVRPGNRTVVHHALIFYARNVADFLEVQAGLGGFFAAYVPGMDQVAYPDGTAKFLPPGGFFVFQMHYTPSGTATTDRTQLGLYLAAGPAARELRTAAAYTTDLQIPPGARDYVRQAERVLTRDSYLYEMSPHMHYRGSWMRFEAILPDGTQETLLNVPKYDFAWQALYRLQEPRRLPAGTRLRITGGFDNSVTNPWNPNPQSLVGFGEQTDDEMFIGYLNYAEIQ
ncbi:MAG: hypothetical protein ACKOET_14605 [Verrucomicrobiota bacterium]